MTKRIFTDAKGRERESPYPDTVTLKVREHHIQRGQRNSNESDPVAEAARDLFPNNLKLVVYDDALHLHADWRMTVWQPTNTRAWKDWRYRYHVGTCVEPVEFELSRVYEQETDEVRNDFVRRYGSSRRP